MEENNNVVNNQATTELQGEVATTNDSSNTAIVFPDEKAFIDRVKREAKKLNNDFVKSLGFESDAQLKELVQKQKDAEEAQKTEYQKLQEQLQAKEQYINQVNRNLKLNEVKMEALNAGIKKERIDYALKLIDVDAIDFNDGQLNKEQLNDKINGLLADFPELKSMTGTQKAGQDFSKSTPPDMLTMDIIKSMSPSEMEKRMDEVLKFLSKK
jgi:hypothetical protein